jgi:hypothetical protein
VNLRDPPLQRLRAGAKDDRVPNPDTIAETTKVEAGLHREDGVRSQNWLRHDGLRVGSAQRVFSADITDERSGVGE